MRKATCIALMQVAQGKPQTFQTRTLQSCLLIPICSDFILIIWRSGGINGYELYEYEMTWKGFDFMLIGRQQVGHMNTEMFFTALLSYFVIVDPIGTSIIFAALTAGKDDAYNRKMALRAVALSVAIIICFGFFGGRFLAQLGITIESFRIAGGLLLFYTAFNMITRDEVLPADRTGSIQEDISFFPMSFPLIAGPGCLTLTVLLFAESELQRSETVALLAAILIVFSLTFLCFLSAKKLSNLIGQSGNNIVKKLLGVVLASLSIQFIADGIMGFLN